MRTTVFGALLCCAMMGCATPTESRLAPENSTHASTAFKVSRITVTVPTTTIHVGESLQPVATVYDLNGNVANVSVSWVNFFKGCVDTAPKTGLSVGTCVGTGSIWAKSGNFYGDAVTITVIQ